MLSRILIVILAVACAFFVYQNKTLKREEAALSHELQKEKSKLADEEKNLENEKSVETELRNEVNQQKSALQSEKSNLESQINSISQKVQVEEQKISGLRESLAQMQKQPGDDQSITLTSRLQMNTERLKELEARVKSGSMTKKEIAQSKAAALNNSKIQSKIQIDTLTGQISVQQSLIKDTQSNLNAWQKKKNDADYSVKTAEYEAELKSQKETLIQMQQQKKEWQLYSQKQAAAITYQSAQADNEEKLSEGQLNAQIEQLKKEQKELQNSKDNAQKDKEAWQNKLKQLRQEYDQEVGKYNDLQQVLMQLQNDYKKFQ